VEIKTRASHVHALISLSKWQHFSEVVHIDLPLMNTTSQRNQHDPNLKICAIQGKVIFRMKSFSKYPIELKKK